MTEKQIQPGDKVYVLRNTSDRIFEETAMDIWPNGLVTESITVHPWHCVFASREDAKAGLIRRAEQRLKQAERELEESKHYLARMRKQHGLNAVSRPEGSER